MKVDSFPGKMFTSKIFSNKHFLAADLLPYFDDEDEGRIPPDGTLFGWDRKKKFLF